MITTIGAIKLSKKDWKIVTNGIVAFFFLIFAGIKIAVHLFAFLIKVAKNAIQWLINTISNAKNTSKTPTQPQKTSTNKNKLEFEIESLFKDGKPAFIYILVAILIILVASLAISNTVTKQDQIDNGDKTGINNSTKYDDLTNHSSVQFVINDDNASYTMERKYDFPFPQKPPEIIVMPETFEGKPITIWDGNFSEYNIIEVVGSKNLEKICNDVFADKTDVSHMKLEKVIFPKDGNLKSVGRWAFFNNDKLHTVIVPQNFESFGVGAFYSCASLSTLVIYNKIPPSGADGLFNDGYNDRFFYKPTVPFTVYVPDDAVETYKESSWGQYNIRPISELTEN